ncbi:hypothetical protein EMPG_17267, partial [Blastomyces silverae]
KLYTWGDSIPGGTLYPGGLYTQGDSISGGLYSQETLYSEALYPGGSIPEDSIPGGTLYPGSSIAGRLYTQRLYTWGDSIP